MAADLALAGCEVRFCEHPRFAAGFRTTLESGVIERLGLGRTGLARPALVTTDIARALAGVRLVNVVVPASGHELFFEALRPHLRAEQLVVVWAGDFGSLRLAHLLSGDEAARPAIVETSTLPWGARLTAPARVEVFVTAERILAAALPATETDDWLPSLLGFWPAFEPAEHVLQVALANPNPLVHPAGCILNAGRIEFARGDFRLYREGMTPAVLALIRAVWHEARRVATALGVAIPYDEADFDKPASIMGELFARPTGKYEAIASVVGPTSLHDRYLTEDLPFGLLPVSEFGRRTGVATPLVDALIDLGSVVCGQDFRRSGRTLRSLGIDALDTAALLRLVRGT
jgi:opine dehydrogenase